MAQSLQTRRKAVPGFPRVYFNDSPGDPLNACGAKGARHVSEFKQMHVKLSKTRRAPQVGRCWQARLGLPTTPVESLRHEVEAPRGNGRARLPDRAAGQRAFTIAEVLVAVFVLGIAAMSLYAGFASGFMLVDSSRQELRATQILTQKAEALRLCSWSSLTNFPITFTELYDPTTTNNGGTVYVGSISTNIPTVIPVTSGYRSNMCMATINLYWTNYNSTQRIVHSRTSQTLVARYGIQNYIWGTTP